MRSYDRHGYINDQQHTGRKVSAERKHGYVNEQDLESSGQYELPDYDSLNNSERERDKHTYRGLDLKPGGGVTHRDTTKPRVGVRNRDTGDAPYKARGQRKLIVVIAVLVILLVAMAATFGVLYFKRTEESSELPLTTSSAETTQASTTPGATINTTTASTTPTTFDSSAIQDMCWLQGIGLIPHPQECQAYYNCSYLGFRDGIPTNFEPFLMECPYPQLFNTETSACEHFEHVTCGERKEAKQGCDYRAIRCAGSRCIPCDVRYPNCVGKEDGFHVYEQKKWSPYYINCYKERSVAELTCPNEPVFGTQLYSPEYGGCVGMDRIPPEHGGMKPNCTGKEDGYYPNEYGRCTHYTECVFGQYKMILACPESQAFDEATKKCSETPTSLCVCGKTGC